MDTVNPHAYIEKPTHPKRVTFWCTVLSKGIIGPYFFENEQGEAFTVNDNRSRAILSEFMFKKLKRRILATFDFKRTACHTAEVTLEVLRPVFEDHLISRRADIVWPPRSCNLTSLDYYLWCAVKDKCYVDKPETIDSLKDNIREAINDIQLHTIDNMLKNWTDRVGYCMASRGSHLNEIIFHY